MSKIHQALSYIHYWLNEENEHSLQAPFIYDLYKKVIANKNPRIDFSGIEKVRERFINSEKTIDVIDFGTGSKVEQTSKRHISKIAKYGTTKRKYAQLLDKLINYLEAEELIEFGTSLGITSLYLSSESSRHLTTFEGDPSLSAIAQAVFEGHNRKNIRLIEGNIDETFPKQMEQGKKIDFAFIDANHNYEATTRYFDWIMKLKQDKTCVVFDDIHLNKEMESAWRTIISHYEVTLSVDLFQFGLIFLNPELRKQHYILTF